VLLKKIVLGVSALAAVAALAACSSGTSAQSADDVQLAAGSANPTSATTTAPATTTQPSTTTPTTTASPTTTTTTIPPKPTTTHTTPPKPATEAAAPLDIPCHITTGACADVSAHKAWLVSDGKIVLGPVSMMPGRPGYRTPIGTFHVTSKVLHYYSHEFDAPMPYSVFFYPGVAFHEGSLGVYSHGCVHLSKSSAETFYSDMYIGETVQIVS
jgi:lipoprotein-anchoring transpeptidase ErfK/SrfK